MSQNSLPTSISSGSMSLSSTAAASNGSEPLSDAESIRMSIANSIGENAVLIVATLNCGKSNWLKFLMQRWGVIHYKFIEVEKVEATSMLVDLWIRPKELPAVYIGGKLFGGLDEVLASRFHGKIIAKLTEAGAF
ncbi:glutaredoxin-like [Capsicum annuum]|nr:glutaredoxin-like [Capsicum annuum]